MAELFRNLVSLIIFGLIIWGVLYIGVVLLPYIVAFICIVFIWYYIKFYRLRKEVERVVREQGGDPNNPFHRPSEEAQGETIEVEYEVVDEKDEKN